MESEAKASKDQVQKTRTGPIDKNNKMMFETSKERKSYLDKMTKQAVDAYENLT